MGVGMVVAPALLQPPVESWHSAAARAAWLLLAGQAEHCTAADVSDHLEQWCRLYEGLLRYFVVSSIMSTDRAAVLGIVLLCLLAALCGYTSHQGVCVF